MKIFVSDIKGLLLNYCLAQKEGGNPQFISPVAPSQIVDLNTGEAVDYTSPEKVLYLIEKHRVSLSFLGDKWLAHSKSGLGFGDTIALAVARCAVSTGNHGSVEVNESLEWAIRNLGGEQ